jgi:hypothetical protein
MWQHKPASDTPITEERENTFPEEVIDRSA